MLRKLPAGLAALFLLSFAMRFSVFILLGRDRNPVFWEHHYAALNLLQGKGLSYAFLGGVTHYAYFECLYSLLSALVYYLTHHNYFFFSIVNILLSSLLPIVIFCLGRDLFTARTGWMSAALTAFHPGLIYYATQFHPLNADALLISLVILCLVKLSIGKNIKEAVWAGIAAGTAFLARSICLIFIPLAGIIISALKLPPRKKLKLFLVTFVIAMAPVAGWTVRNYAVFQTVILTRSSTGFLFWLGNNPNATGSAMYDATKPVLDTLDAQARARLPEMTELEQNAFFMREALAYIRQNPLAFFQRWGTKFCHFWWFSPQTGFLYPKSYTLLYQFYYPPVFFLALFAIGAAALNLFKEGVYKPGILITLSSLALLSLSQSLFYVEGRHRWAVEAALLIFTSRGALFLFDRFKPGAPCLPARK